MQLLHSPLSPFGRKVLIAASELGLSDRISVVVTNPRADNATLRPKNPLGKIPTLITDDGQSIIDSFVIVLYLQQLAKSHRLFPAEQSAQVEVMMHHAVADGMVNATIIKMQNKTRHSEHQGVPLDDVYMQRQDMAINHALDYCEQHLSAIGREPLHVAGLALICSLGYLDLRFPDWGWRTGCPGLAAWYATMLKRPAVAATQPVA